MKGGNAEAGAQKLRIAFVSSNPSWGGSEELWSAAAAALAAEGHAVHAYKSFIDRREPRVNALLRHGASITDLAHVPLLPSRTWSRLSRLVQNVVLRQQGRRLSLALRLRQRPDLVVLSQGDNLDGRTVIEAIHRSGAPYVVIVQKATDLNWPADSQLELLRRMYRNARWCFFVSEHNRRVTEEQLAIELPNASVVRNPFLVPWEWNHGWPDEADGLRLACVGRLYPEEKGQDLLLRVLARDKWRQRPLQVTFYGTGPQQRGLAEMADLLNLSQVRFGGFVRDVPAIWQNHHALILPSRCEGLPLVAVEAMMAHRVAILTDVGGAREVVTDGVTGFIAAAATEDMLDDALERAWQRRGEWREIGQAAAAAIRQLVPEDPPGVFARQLLAAARGDAVRGQAGTEE